MKNKLRNITVTLEVELARWARIEAARKDLSVSRFLALLLQYEREEHEEYAASLKRSLKRKPFLRTGGGICRARKRMNDRVFVDTNVLLDTVGESDPEKHRVARLWREWLWKTRRGRTSFQVLYANVLRKWPQAKSAAREEISDLLSCRPISVNGDLLRSAWQLQDRFGFSFWDSLIVAAVKASLFGVLLS